MSNLPPAISRALLGKIVDDVFDGGIEDASIIEEIYAVIARENAPPAPASIDRDATWRWFSGSNDEFYSNGLYKTRDAAVQAGWLMLTEPFECEKGHKLVSFYVTEAQQAPIILSDWIGIERLIEQAEDEITDSDRYNPEYDSYAVFELSKEQHESFEKHIRAACDEWQAREGVRFSTNTFTATRNGEKITMEAPPAISQEASHG